jgi:hypothetical protein
MNKIRHLSFVAVFILAMVPLYAFGQGFSFPGSGQVSPHEIWNNAHKSNQPQAYRSEFSLDYADPGSFQDNEGFGFSLERAKARIEGRGYFDGVNPNNPKMDASVKYLFSSGSSSLSDNIDLRMVNNNLYLKASRLPSELFDQAALLNQWLKLGLDEQGELNSGFDHVLQEKIRKIWEEHQVINITDFAGWEEVNGAASFHFAADLNKANVKKAMAETSKVIAEHFGGIMGEEVDGPTQYFFNKLLEKVEIQELDIWVGARDGNIVKVHLVTNAPSIASVAKVFVGSSMQSMDIYDPDKEAKRQIDDLLGQIKFNATFSMDQTYMYGVTQAVEEPAGAYDILQQARQSAQDAKRLADVRQLASALELHFNDYGDYPNSLPALSPMYLGELPTAPTPPGRDCSEADNNYSYTYKGSGNYELRFCLGEDTGGYGRGVRTLTPNGIN